MHHVEGDDVNDVNDTNDGSTERKNYIINYNRSKKIDEQNENEKRTNDLQIFPPTDLNGPSEMAVD